MNINAIDKNYLIECLRRIVDKLSGIDVLILFGSYAENRATPLSDIDIAVLTENRNVVTELKRKLAYEFDLNSTSSILKIKILKKGIVIHGDVTKIVNIIEPDVIEVIEFEKEWFYKWLKNQDPVDENVITTIITQIELDIRFLRRLLQERTFDEVVNDDVLRRTFERTLHTIIEGILDLLQHIISGFRLGIAERYRDYVDIAAKNNIITQDTASKLSEFVEIRRKLIHRYRTFNYQELWKKQNK